MNTNLFKVLSRMLKAIEKILKMILQILHQIAMDLGVDFSDVDGLKEANDLSRKLDGLTSNLPKGLQETRLNE